MKNIGLYIHIPYCLSKCLYCDFVSYAGAEDTQERYVAALIREIVFYGNKYKNFYADTIYLGGGTPSILPSGAVAEILSAVKACFTVSPDAEMSIELNPKTVNAQKAQEYIRSGINRFSVGLQSSENDALRAAGRAHSYHDFLETFALLKDAGAKNISADIMLGLPAQTLEGVKHTAAEIVRLGAGHASAYGLILEAGTPLYKAVKENKTILPDEDEAADMYDAVYKIFEGAGLCRYEVSSFAREGFRCRHNLNYWHRGEYLGLGAAAHGFVKNRRYENEREIHSYINKVERGFTGKCAEQKITLDDAEKEYIMLGLRLEEGLDTAKFEEIFCVDFFQKYENALKKLYNIGMVYFEGRFLKIPPARFSLLNKIIVEFF